MLILDFPNAPCPIGQSAIVPRCVLATKCSSTELRADGDKFRKKNVIFQTFNNISYHMWRNRTVHFGIPPTCKPLYSSTCQLTTFCPFFSRDFNIMAAFLSTKLQPGRKKSILAKVCFEAKRGQHAMLAK